MTPQLEQAREALESAKMFIKNGVALGFIRMPDKDVPDTAHNTLPKIEAALKVLSETPPTEDRARALEDFTQSIKSGEDKTVSRSRVLSEFNDWDCVEYNTILNALETIEKCGWKITKE